MTCYRLPKSGNEDSVRIIDNFGADIQFAGYDCHKCELITVENSHSALKHLLKHRFNASNRNSGNAHLWMQHTPGPHGAPITDGALPPLFVIDFDSATDAAFRATLGLLWTTALVTENFSL